MGRQVGFELYKYVDGKLQPQNIIEDLDYASGKTNYTFICGRCEATTIFLKAVCKYDPDWIRNFLDTYDPAVHGPNQNYSAYLLLNHPELDGYSTQRSDDPDGHFSKYFYMDLKDFENLFDFDMAEKEHNESIIRWNERIKCMQAKVARYEELQTKAETEAAFDGFQKKIDKLEEDIQSEHADMKEFAEDDYDYNHYKWIKEDLETMKKLIREDPDLVLVAFASD